MRTWIAMVAVTGCTDAPRDIPSTHALYQVTHQYVATNPSAYAMDLDGDGMAENHLGDAFKAIASLHFGDPQAATDVASTHGSAALVLDLQHAGADAAVNSFGGGAADYDPTSPVQAALPGAADGELVSAGPGDFAIVIAPFETPLVTTLHHARVQLIAAPDSTTAVIAGGIDPAFVHDTLLPAWANILAEIIQHDCATRISPACGCTAGTPGAQAITTFDANHDCVVEAAELASNALVANELFPDVTLDDRPLLSFGFGLEATFAGSR